ncbi:hypothetical protein V7S43_010764 [Phytophthora oleae]|uniref:Crinkler effector protein N-terminal domain-containing protein n=1 Tax=Phytophthora oleae TaxID=2107226 RepID=A0ABD3FBY5_9STRA
MLKLFCAIVSGSGSVIEVAIDASVSVNTLKEAIKTNSCNFITVPPLMLKLFLAKTKDGEWLPDDDLDAMLLSGNCTLSYMKMRATWKLKMQNVLDQTFRSART